MESFCSSRRPRFIEEDDDLPSFSEMGAGFAGTHYQNCNKDGFFSRILTSSSASSPRFSRFYDSRFEDHYHHHQPHFLDSCFLCKKPLGLNRDIFMYRGDTPFCSEECRQEQIEMDESMEKNRNLCSSMKLALRNKDQMKSKSSNKAQDYPFHTGTIAAA